MSLSSTRAARDGKGKRGEEGETLAWKAPRPGGVGRRGGAGPGGAGGCGAARDGFVGGGPACRALGDGLPFPSPRDLSDPGMEPASLTSSALAGKFFTTSAA